jgi:hypothetical protein
MNLYQTFWQNHLVISIIFSKFVPATNQQQTHEQQFSKLKVLWSYGARPRLLSVNSTTLSLAKTQEPIA